MRIGKLDNDTLDKIILKQLKHTRPEVREAPTVGADCAVVSLGGSSAVLSCDPITATDELAGFLAVHINCNDAAAAGAEPVGLLITLLCPPDSTLDKISGIARELSSAAQSVNVDIIGGHTEITDSVNRVIIAATVIGKASASGALLPDGAKYGDCLVMTKTAGLEGSCILAQKYGDALNMREGELLEAKNYINSISIIPEARIACENGAHAMHDVTEGGILGAIWELCHHKGLSCTVDINAIPITSVTSRICEKLGIDPLRLISSGSLLIACADGEAMVKKLCSAGIKATVIARIGKAGSGVFDTSGNPIAPPNSDEIYMADRKETAINE